MMMKCMPFWKGCNRSVDYIDQSHRCLTAVPDDVLRCSRTLEELMLDSNQIRDLPPSFFSLGLLRKLSLNDNQITRLTNDIGNLTNLQELDVSHNELVNIPDSIKQCKSLQIADFSSNPLKDLPAGLTQLKNLTHLILNDVGLRKLPDDIGSLTSLESLELRDNLLSQFPTSLNQLVNLQFLDAGSNMIEDVPDFIGSLCKLEELRLDCNEILELPAELGQLRKLTQLDVSENNLKQLPQEIGSLTNLTDLHLSQNQLEYLPDGIGFLHKLCTLKVDQNHLVQLTPAIGNCTALQELILTENLLPELPGTVGKLKLLTILNVDRNRLTNIPSKIGGCMRLGVLSLRENNLWRLPPELGFLKELHVLDVSGNRLQHLPLSLGTCNLKALWLSENQAQPLLKFQQDVDEETGEKVLTCFLLPQQAFTDSMENLLRDSFAVMSDHDSRFSWLDHTRGSSVKFAEDDRDQDSEDEMQKVPGSLSGDENHFVRHNTPHPKDLRVRHNKLFVRDVDGHMIPHKQKRGELDSGFILSNDHDNYNALQSDSLPNNLNSDVKMYNETAEERTNYNTAEEAQISHGSANMGILCGEEEDAIDAVRPEAVQRKNQNGIDEYNRTNHIDAHENYITVMPNCKQMTIQIVRSAGVGLGISIAGGLGSHPFVDDDEGIFISKVNSNGVAEQKGILVGDKILSVNGISLENIEHSQAVTVLRSAGYDVTLVIVRTSAVTDSQGEANDKSAVHSITLDNLSATGTPSPVAKTAPGRSEIVKFSESCAEPNTPAKADSVQAKPRSSPRLPGPILKFRTSGGDDFECSEAEEYFTPTAGSSALPPVFGDRRLAEVTKPEDVARSPGRTRAAVIQYQVRRSPQPLSSALTFEDRSPLTRLASSQSQTIDALGNADSTYVRHATDSTSNSALEKKTLSVTSSNSTSLSISSGASSSAVASDPYPKETVVIVKSGRPLGLSIVGGRGHTSHPFGIDEPGIFISKIQPHGTAAKTSKLRIGDRILAVNGVSMQNASHQEAVLALIAPTHETVLEVQHDPQPSGLKDIVIHKAPGERLGLSITGGAGSPCGNVSDMTDEGIFISRIIAGTVAALDGRLSVGMRILEVNGQSLLGTTQQEAAQNLQAAGNSLSLLVCHGFDVTQCRRDSSAGVRQPSKESEILTPSLSKLPASPSPLPPLPSSSVKTVSGKNRLISTTPSTDNFQTLNAMPAGTNRDKGKSTESFAADSDSSLRAVNENTKPKSNDAPGLRPTASPVATSQKNLSAEEERRMRAEQRRITRLKFLQEAAAKTQDSSKVLKEFPHTNLRH